MKNQQVINSAEQIINQFFGSALESCDITSHERLLEVDITYRDFKPLTDVRLWLNLHIPYLWSLHVDRVYSDIVTNAAMQCLYEQDNDVRERVEELLFTEDLE